MAVSRSSDLLEIGTDEGSSLLIRKSHQPKTTCPPKTFKLPPSSVLQNVRNFLPQMAAAQENLDKRRKEAPEENFDIENVDDCEKVIEMTLALVEQNSDSESLDDSSDSEDESCSLSLKDTGLFGSVTENNLRLPGPKVAPKIEVINPKPPSSSISAQIEDSTDIDDTDMIQAAQ